MTRYTSKQSAIARAITILGLATALLAAASAATEARSQESQSGLVGTWTIQVTLRDCTTNAPLGPPFNSLVTFHHDGTLSESAGSLSFAPGQRSPGHGGWTRGREHTYGQEMIAMILFDTAANLPGTPTFDPTKPVSPGFFAGWQTVSHTIRFTDDDEIASEGTNRFYKATGELYRSGCSTATGQRF